ncbi:hypothetical protein CRX72_08945 [Pantoea sp. BRM17]|nr:hypothetical protein CRX72_08945 [Pantoea sp. BRM17]
MAILGVSKSAMEPVWNGKEFAPRLMMPISLSFDHRVIDGADGSLSEDGQKLTLKKYINIGVAVDTPNGLVVPVFKDVNKKGITELSRELMATSKKARDGKLTASDMQGANLSRNWVMIPHVTHFDKTDITDLEAFRKQQNAEAEKRKLDVKFTPVVFIMKAVAAALEQMPRFNRGTGRKGRILKEDVQTYVKEAVKRAEAAPAAAAGGGLPGMLPWPKVDFSKFGEVEEVELGRIQKISGAPSPAPAAKPEAVAAPAKAEAKPAAAPAPAKAEAKSEFAENDAYVHATPVIRRLAREFGVNLAKVKEVEVTEVLVKAGDKVTAEQSLIVVEGDKASMEVPAPFAGTVKELKVATGDKVSTGSLIMIFEVEGGPFAGVVKEIKIATGDKVNTGSLIMIFDAEGDAPAADAKPQMKEEATSAPAAAAGAKEVNVPDIGGDAEEKKAEAAPAPAAATATASKEVNVPDIGGDEVEVTEILVKVGDKVEAEQSLITVEGDKASMEVPAILVKVGDSVEAEQSLISVEGDKASMEVPSPQAGVVKEIKIAVGDKVNTGSLIMVFDAESAAEAAPARHMW